MAQDNQVVIDFVGNTDQLQKSLQDVDKQVIKTGKDYETAFAEVNKANQQAEQGTKQLATNLQDLNKTVANGAIKEYSKDLQGAVEKLYEQGKVTEALITKYGTATGALKAMQKELATMAALGQSGTKQFKELAKATAELQDTIGDTRGEIKKLASDTRVFDTLVQGARGMAAGFSLVTGTMAALGSENENVQKTLLKVQGAMAALQGVQELANIATEKGGILTQAYGAAISVVEFIQKRFAISSAAAWAAATGGVTVLVAAVVGLAYWLSNATTESEKLEAQEKKRKEEFGTQFKDQIDSLKKLDQRQDIDLKKEKIRNEETKEFQKRQLLERLSLITQLQQQVKYNRETNAIDEKTYSELSVQLEKEHVETRLAIHNLFNEKKKDNTKSELKDYINSLRERQKADEAYILSQLNAYDEADKKLRQALVEAGDNTEQTREQRIQYYFLAGMNKDEIAKRLGEIISDADKQAADIANSRIKNTEYTRGYFAKIWSDAKENEVKQELDNRKLISSETIKIAKETTDSIFQIEADARAQQLANDLKKVADARDKELSNKNLTETQKAAIDKKYAAEEAKLKRKQWEADKEAKLEQAIINGALAITNILATMNWATFGIAQALAIAGAVASTAAQVAVISSAKPPAFAKGTEYVEQGNAPSGVDTIHARLNIGERVVPTEINKQLAGIKNEDLPKLLQAAYYPPMPHAPEMSGLNAVVVKQDIDYKKLGKVIAEELRANPQTHINIDKGGFSLHVIEKGKKVQSLNNRYES